MLLVSSVALAGVRVYDVDVYKNVNGLTPRGGYVAQSFINTCDTIKWVEFFVGRANGGGLYEFAIQTDARDIATGAASAGAGVNNQWVRAQLTHVGPPLIKGKSYVLKIMHSGDESINFF